MSRRRLLWGVGAVAVVALLALGWLAWSGLQARTELDAARAAAERLRTALARGDIVAARTDLDTLRTHADRARQLTADPLWRAAGVLPVLGRTPHAVTVTTDALATAADTALPGLVDAAGNLDPQRLRHGSTIDVEALRAAAPALDQAAAGLDTARRRLAALDLAAVPGLVASGVTQVRDQLGSVASQVDAVTQAAHLLPSMLGADGVRRYLVVVQNVAEARGTGGLVGAYAVVAADNGALTVNSLGADTDLRSATAPVVDLGPAYRGLFGDDTALWANTNVSADFPSAARQQLVLWQRQHGQRLDGVVAVDPVLLGYLLTTTGPAQLPGGGSVSGGGLAPLLLQDVYARFPTSGDNAARKRYLVAVAGSALERLLGATPTSARAQVDALGRAVGERRLLIYSAHPAEQSRLATLPVSGVVDDTPGPYAALVLDNAAGNKLDYYVDRSLVYAPGCPSAAGGTTTTSTITVTLTDHAPTHGLPPYAAYRLDRGPATSAAGRGGDGSTRETVLVYLSVGARVAGATLDGAALATTPGIDGAGAGRPVVAFSVELEPGVARTAVLRVSEPASGVAPRVWVGPLVREPVATVTAGTCR